jgi:PAS domain S-box-containing protein
MRSNLYQKIGAVFDTDARQRQKYVQMFLAWSGYLLPVMLLVLAFLWVKSLAIDVDRHNQYLAHLRQIQTLDARINQNILQVRDELLNNYDPIVNDLAQLKQLQIDLQQPPSFIDKYSDRELDRLLQKHINIWQQKEESILKFQSQNAILINSLTYFPIAIADITAKDPAAHAQNDRLNNLLRDILLVNISNNKILVAPIKREIPRILTDLTSQTGGTAIKMALNHARIILDKREQVNNSVATVMKLPTTQSSENLALAYNHRYQQAIDRTNNYRLWFYLLSILLVAGIATWILLKIRLYAAATQQAEAKFALAFRFGPNIFCITTFPDSRFIEVNERFCSQTGYSSEEVIGRSGLELNLYQNPADRTRILQLLQEKGSVRHQEVTLRTKTGEAKTALLSAELFNLNGQTACLWVSEDISDRKKVEAALQQAKLAAEVANRTKSQFLANMSHELRTPLNIILGFTQLLTRDALRNGTASPQEHRLLATQQQEYLDTIARSGEHLLELINDVLEMSKIEAGRASLNETSFDFHRQLQTLDDMWQLKARAKGLHLTIERQAAVPQYAIADERKLRQVLMNLLSNAIKFTKTGQVNLRVEVRLHTPSTEYTDGTDGNNSCSDQRLCFEVEDTGSGITSDELANLFDAFAQTESGRQSQQGTGLGLAISQEFVRLMGGNLTLVTAVGQGTTFRFELPLVMPSETSEPNDNAVENFPAQTQQQVIGLAPDRPSYRLLVVEDQRESRQFLVQLLEPLGFEVRQAVNGQEAIDLWASFAPHLIWMDLRMPVLDGYAATRQIKAQPLGQTTVIIALTASAFEEERALALAAGCDDFIRKPCRAAEIFDKMAHYLGVRYQYAPLAAPIEPVTIPSHLTTLLQLEKMPTSWQEQLHLAATQVDAEQIVQLIQQIPPEYSNLALAITDLVNCYRFDRIVELTQSSPNHP